MKYVIRPVALLSIIFVVLCIGIMVVSIVTPSVILDFLKSITPDTEAELRAAYLILTLAGAVILFFVLRHTKPYKFKGKKAKNSK